MRGRFKNIVSEIQDALVFKASDVKKIPEFSLDLSRNLSKIDQIQYIKIYKSKLLASNKLGYKPYKEPIIEIGDPSTVGLELLIDYDNNSLQFYSISSSVKGCGEKMISCVLAAVPDDWHIYVVFDYSGGFWQKMSEKYPRIILA